MSSRGEVFSYLVGPSTVIGRDPGDMDPPSLTFGHGGMRLIPNLDTNRSQSSWGQVKAAGPPRATKANGFDERTATGFPLFHWLWRGCLLLRIEPFWRAGTLLGLQLATSRPATGQALDSFEKDWKNQ